MNGKTELIFKINGKHYWEEIRDTIHRIANEFGDKHAVRIEVEKIPCYADASGQSPPKSESASFSNVPSWNDKLVTFSLTQPQEQKS